MVTPPHPTRRRLLGAGLAALGWPGLARAGEPDITRWRLAADFEPLRAVWLGFDAGHADFTAALVRALLPHVPLKMLVRPDEQDDAAHALGTRGISAAALQWQPSAQARYFVRDASAFLAGPDGELDAVLEFLDNQHGLPGWCRQRFASDRRQADACAAAASTGRNALAREIGRLAGAHGVHCDLVLEGGALENNGQGLLLVNEALMHQRNPGLGRARMEAALKAIPGVQQVLWLHAGLAEDPQMRATIVGQHVGWGTGGHTDQFVRFADARTVLLAWPDNDDARTHPVARLTRLRMQRNAALLAAARTPEGQPLVVVKVPMPRPVQRRLVLKDEADTRWADQWTADHFPPQEGREPGDVVWQVAPASWLNFIVANGVVVLPDYVPQGTPAARQRQVQALFERVFPGREVVFVDAMNANWHGGGPHCASLNEPA